MFKKYLKLMYPQFSVVEDEGGMADSEPTEQGNAQVSNSDEPVDEDRSWVEKRGFKNVREELNRKSEELKKLRAEIETVKQPVRQPEPPRVQHTQMKYPPEMQEHYDWLVSKYGDKEYAERTCDTMLKVAVNASREISRTTTEAKFQTLSKVQQKYQSEALTDAIKTLGQDKKYKPTVSLHEKEIVEYMKKEIDPQYWEDEQVIKSVIGLVNAEHSVDIEEPKREVSRVNETENYNTPKGTVGISSEDLQDYANQFGLDLSNPAIRKSAIKGVEARKRAEKRLE